MHRCFIEHERWNNITVTPSPEEAHHIRHVLRARDGEPIRLFDGTGREAAAVVHLVDGGDVTLEIRELLTASDRGFEIVLIQAVLKGSRMDLLIEKATELGVSRIVPVMTQRVIPRLDAAQGTQKKERWERITISAAKQCGTRWLPVIETPQTLDAAMRNAAASGPVLLASLEKQTRPLATVIDGMRAATPPAIAIVIGPEGDLTPAETGSLLAAGAIPVSLGRLTLRAETAAIFAVSALACMLRPD